MASGIYAGMNGLPASAVFAGNAIGFKKVGGLTAAVAAGAAEDDGLIHSPDFFEALGNFLQRNVQTSGNLPSGKFTRTAYIDNGHVSFVYKR
jgi:hypothetical protein